MIRHQIVTVYLSVSVVIFQMNAGGLAVCFLPSFFQQSTPSSPAGGIITDIKPALACIGYLIVNVHAIFQVVLALSTYLLCRVVIASSHCG